MKLLTNLIFEPKGKHDPALAYTIKDTVMSADGSKVYFALQDVPAGTALNNEDYWKLQIDLSGSKSAMDEALASFSDYAKIVGTRVKGETAKASGNPVTFLPDAGSLLQPVTVLEPKQAGSGDPYPAGGGRNLLSYVGIAGDIFLKALVRLEAGKTYTLSVQKKPDALYFSNEGGSVDFATNTSSMSLTYTAETTDSYSVLARYSTGASVDFGMMLEEGATASEYQPYSNIRPITGYDAVELNHAGKNLLPLPTEPLTVSGVTFTPNADGSISCVGTAAETINYALLGRWNSTVPLGMLWANKTYVLSGYTSNVAVRAISGTSTLLSETRTKRTTDKPMPITAVYVGVAAGTTVNERVYPQVEEADSPSDFVPYQSTLHTVQIGQTVYGGKMDWLTGKLVKVWPAAALRDLTISYKGGDHNYFEINMPSDALATADFLCESYKNVGVLYYSSMPTTPTGCMGYYPQDRVWRLKDTRYTSVDELLAGNGDMKITYKLATPIEIQLTPHIISAVDPEQTNTLYGDGSIDVEYVKPLHVSIEERVAAAVAAAMNTEGE